MPRKYDKKAPGRQPDYDICALDKQTEQKTTVGAAWIEANGRISLKIDYCVVLTSDPNLLLSLFPRDNSGGSTNEFDDYRKRYVDRKKTEGIVEPLDEGQPLDDENIPY